MSTNADITAQLNADSLALPGETYAALRRLAQQQLSQHRQSPTLNATALVNEAWLKLTPEGSNWHSRGHFMATMARVMRHVMIDHARERSAQRRGGDAQRVTLQGVDLAAADDGPGLLDLLALDQAMQRLGALDARLERVLELRLFAGLSIEETAQALGVSEPTIKRDLRAARAFVSAELGQGSELPE